MPVSVVPAGVAAALEEFLGQVDGEALVSFAGSLTLAAFEGVPESANGKEMAAKTKVRLNDDEGIVACCVFLMHIESACDREVHTRPS